MLFIVFLGLYCYNKTKNDNNNYEYISNGLVCIITIGEYDDDYGGQSGEHLLFCDTLPF